VKRALSVALLAAAVVAAVSPARADLCPKCRRMMFTADVGRCVVCGGPTSSGSHKLCHTCSKKLGECEHCRAKLADGPKADGHKPRPAAPKIVWGEPVGNLQLGLSAKRERFVPGRPMAFVVHFRNVGRKVLRVGRPRNETGLYFVPTAGGKDVKALKWETGFHGKDPRKPLIVQPGKAATLNITVFDRWVLTKTEAGKSVRANRLPSGTYEVRAGYSDPAYAHMAVRNPVSGHLTIQVEGDNAILALVFKQQPGRRPLRVARKTDPSRLTGRGAPDAQARMRKYVIGAFKKQGHDVATLYDALLRKNRKPVALTVPSSPDDGYVIDEGKGFGVTRVSLPAHDPKAGLILVYVGRVEAPLAGAGYLVLYKRDGERLKEVHRVMLWMS